MTTPPQRPMVMASGPLYHIQSIYHSIHWVEDWPISAVLVAHLGCTVGLWRARRTPYSVGFASIVFLALASLSKAINRFCSTHHSLSQDYFDPHGFFITLVWAGPLIFNALFAVVLLVKEIERLLGDATVFMRKESMGGGVRLHDIKREVKVKVN